MKSFTIDIEGGPLASHGGDEGLVRFAEAFGKMPGVRGEAVALDTSSGRFSATFTMDAETPKEAAALGLVSFAAAYAMILELMLEFRLTVRDDEGAEQSYSANFGLDPIREVA